VSAYRVTVRLPHYALFAPGVGWMLGTLGLTKAEAEARLADRIVNGGAFPRERVRRMRVEVTVGPDLDVRGYLLGGQ
jgi:hypothetical protein